MEKKLLKLLNEFANDDVLATDIEVSISEHHKSFTPRIPNSYAKYEDANLLASVITGAERFCYFLCRNNYKIVKGKKDDK